MNYVIRNTPMPSMEALFKSSGIHGVRARTGLFEQVVESLMALISRHRDPGAEVLRFPPVTNRSHIETSGYLHSFPHLLGAVCCLDGDEREVRAAIDSAKTDGGWLSALKPTDLVLTPAACYPLYPLLAARDATPDTGLVFDVASDCFRHEPSKDIDRLQSFRMREFVMVGGPDAVAPFREEWMSRAADLADVLGLAHSVAPASDPFFGRAGKLMAINQKEAQAKFELLIPVRPGEDPTACMSFNYHRDHFGAKWGLRLQSGAVAHTGCVAFGIDRLVLALFATHDTDLKRWPAATREALGL
jgi:seryl-tRNA synthetase